MTLNTVETIQHPDSRHDSDTTATTSSEEFDWDEEDNKNGEAENIKAKRGRRLWLAFLKLARPIRVLLVGSIGAVILISPFIIINLRFRDSPVKLQVQVWSLWLAIVWAVSCVIYLVVDAIPRIVIATMNLIGGQVESLKTQLELTMAVSGWLKLALDVSGMWISLSVITAAYKPPGYYWDAINHVVQIFFAASILLLIEKLLLHLVAINFHQRALAERLAENRLALKVLDRLSNAQLIPTRKGIHGKKGHKSHGSAGVTMEVDNGHEYVQETMDSMLNEKSDHSVSARNSKQSRGRMAVASIIVDQVGGAIGQVALKNSKFYKGGEIGGLHSARKLAKKLFSVLSDVNPSRSHLLVEDFCPYFRTTAEAHEAFALFDKDKNGDISKKEMREAVQRIYRERKALIAGLKDVGSIVAKLDAVLLSVALVTFIFICLLIFNSNSLASLVPLATVILGFSFVFGNSAATLFESLIFIFSTHVFDVGDLVMIDNDPLFVREFGLFSTTFRRVDGLEVIAPNSLLAKQKLVHNLRRSKSMWESTTLTVSYNTPMEVIEQMKQRINSYVSANSREWSACSVNIDKMEYQNALCLIVAIEHRPNWQDWGGRWERRTAFMRNLKTILEDLDIRYTMPIQPVLLPRSLLGKVSAVGQGDQGNIYRSTSSPHLRVPNTVGV
ncbi:hypothetical protein M378DRAFT_161839 [Amanita muscaria Koide BX008]|uniref:EF-hand domain-containing protein n=1 Tax=Amanita muscaria (strain Koide BX008) TaxID=946122 RepID=A0A0C2WUV5_AMAMK|nr:hypothetical protein M378DRAFT_161839 [Amanita muscaria Koide BX008]